MRHCFQECRSKKGLPWGFLLRLLLQYRLSHINPSSNWCLSGFRRILHVKCSIPELFFEMAEGRHRQRSLGNWFHSLKSYWAESAAFPSPRQKLAGAAETRTMKGTCSSRVTRGEVSSSSTVTKAWKMPGRAGRQQRAACDRPTATVIHHAPCPALEKTVGDM